MPTHNHGQLNLSDRVAIEKLLSEGLSFRAIAKNLSVSPSTISREVKRNSKIKRVDLSNRKAKYVCKNYTDCPVVGLCEKCFSDTKDCKDCKRIRCQNLCTEFSERLCSLLTRPPYVCNSCGKRGQCGFTTKIYKAQHAQEKALKLRSSSRTGIDITKSDLIIMGERVQKLLSQGQSLEAIWTTHKDEFPVSVRTFYRYVEAGYFGLCGLHLQKNVKYKIRHKKSSAVRVAKSLATRDFSHYLKLSDDERLSVCQMDTICGMRGDSKCVLSLHFVRFHFQIYLLLQQKTQAEVKRALDYLELVFGESFRELFSIILTDRGTEFFRL